MSEPKKSCSVCGASAPFMNLCIPCSLWQSFEEIKIRGGGLQAATASTDPIDEGDAERPSLGAP